MTWQADVIGADRRGRPASARRVAVLMAIAVRDGSPDTAEPDAAGPARIGLSRAVIWTGITLGTFLAILAISDGARPRIGGMPACSACSSGRCWCGR